MKKSTWQRVTVALLTVVMLFGMTGCGGGSGDGDVIEFTMFAAMPAPEINDGSVIVDKENLKIVDYNTTPTAKRYFTKLNEEYKKGTIDVELATQTYDEYIAKLSTGAVLGMCDQWWDFYATVNDTFKQQGLDQLGCNYVPLGLATDAGMENRWHTYGDTLNVSSGVAVTTSCKNVDAAFKFMNDILEQDIHDLRFWGVKGVDYLVDENGMYYKTDEMRTQWADKAYQEAQWSSPNQ